MTRRLLLDRLRREQPGLPVVLMTAFGSVSTAVEAMKQGAADYLTKPFERDELLLVLDKALRHRRLEQEVASLHGQLQDRWRLDSLIGTSAAMQEVFSLVERVAWAEVPVLIGGESGTGKELVARAIHRQSRRVAGPFVALNCAAIPETLIESEFFGHERGAFTDAVRARPGRFEQAQGGTLLLDEIGALRVDLQAKLARQRPRAGQLHRAHDRAGARRADHGGGPAGGRAARSGRHGRRDGRLRPATRRGQPAAARAPPDPRGAAPVAREP